MGIMILSKNNTIKNKKNYSDFTPPKIHQYYINRGTFFQANRRGGEKRIKPTESIGK